MPVLDGACIIHADARDARAPCTPFDLEGFLCCFARGVCSWQPGRRAVSEPAVPVLLWLFVSCCRNRRQTSTPLALGRCHGIRIANCWVLPDLLVLQSSDALSQSCGWVADKRRMDIDGLSRDADLQPDGQRTSPQVAMSNKDTRCALGLSEKACETVRPKQRNVGKYERGTSIKQEQQRLDHNVAALQPMAMAMARDRSDKRKERERKQAERPVFEAERGQT